MKYLDTNVFVRFIAKPTTTNDVLFGQLASEIFAAAEAGADQYTTTDAVIAEVVFILSDPKHYRFTRYEVLTRLVPLLRLPGCAIVHREEIVAAIGRWEGNPKISFVDALSIAIAKQAGYDLVTFDTAMARAADVPRWDKASIDANGEQQ